MPAASPSEERPAFLTLRFYSDGTSAFDVGPAPAPRTSEALTKMVGAVGFLLWQTHQFVYEGLLAREMAKTALLDALKRMPEGREN